MANLNVHLQSVENQLNLLVGELMRLEASASTHNERLERETWSEALEGFRLKAVTIRRILDRFHGSDLSTRRYLRHHLDEEFSRLQEAYDELRDQFTAWDEQSK